MDIYSTLVFIAFVVEMVGSVSDRLMWFLFKLVSALIALIAGWLLR